MQDDLHIYIFYSILGLSDVSEADVQIRSCDAKKFPKKKLLKYIFIMVSVLLDGILTLNLRASHVEAEVNC